MNINRAQWLALCLIMVTAATQAKPWWLRGVETNENDFLPPDVAFRVGALTEGNSIRVRWVIADGYYLYRSKMDFKPESPDLMLAQPELPPGVQKTDPYLGNQRIYTQQVDVNVPYSRIDGGAHPLQIKVVYQGCAEAGLCYPPITKVLFPRALVAPGTVNGPQSWEVAAIVGGAAAFMLAGFVLRKNRKLASPVP